MRNEKMQTKPENSNEQENGSALRDAACSPRIFRVTATFDTVIIAESEKDALAAVKYGMGDIDDMPVSSAASLILSRNDLPKGWDVHCLPWGRQPLGMDKSIADFIEENSFINRPVALDDEKRPNQNQETI